jgi:hypothetical protein
MRQPRCEKESAGQTNDGERDTLTNDEPGDLAAIGAECDADANLPGAPTDPIRQNAIEPDCRYSSRSSR